MDDVLTARLRLALRQFVKDCGTRRAIPTTLRIGRPGGPHLALPDDPSYDSGLRADVLERALDGLDLDTAVPWLTRSGDLAPADADFLWMAAATEAFGRHGIGMPGFIVMTRYGWYNLVDGQTMQWRRIRPNRSA
ncbi:MAG TPA: hypothetical protein VHZ06_09630 [Marmoricola sp.]|jgi:hypothetical protein|nr:hypothetical protein [Marmoricola sp.]